MRVRIFLLLLIVFLINSCAHKHEPLKTHAEPVKITVRTDKTELFMEYDSIAAGEKSVFLIHLTKLKDFKPVTEGSLILVFMQRAEGRAEDMVTVRIDSPERPGIFKSDVVLKTPGKYSLKIVIEGQKLSDEIIIPEVFAAGKKDEISEKNNAKNRGSEIFFTKEQQWTVDFMVETAVKRSLSSSFVSMGELIPASNAEFTASSPLSGVISSHKSLPYIGKRVLKGEAIAAIEPPVQQQGGAGQLTASYAEARNRLLLARNEHERAKRLYEAKAVPKRRLEEAELALNTAIAVIEPLEKAMKEIENRTSENRLIIKAPISGTVVEVMTSNGKFVDAGHPVLKIVNTSVIWLKANIPATDIGRIKKTDAAVFTIAGIEGEFKTSRLVTVSDMVEMKNRTVPVIFEINNPKGMFKIGMFADVSIKTGQSENVITLPEEALFEDEGRYFVFVQLSGEAFERREVKTGIKDRGYVHITEGIMEGELVVTKGGYYVKLASLSSKLPQAHGHDH